MSFVTYDGITVKLTPSEAIEKILDMARMALMEEENDLPLIKHAGEEALGMISRMLDEQVEALDMLSPNHISRPKSLTSDTRDPVISNFQQVFSLANSVRLTRDDFDDDPDLLAEMRSQTGAFEMTEAFVHTYKPQLQELLGLEDKPTLELKAPKQAPRPRMGF